MPAASDGDHQEPRSALVRHRFAPLVEPLRQLPSFVSRPMFGWVGCYDALRRAFPELTVHPVLQKWLYLASRAGGFAGVPSALVERIAAGDMTIGVEPKIRPPRFRQPRPRRSRFGYA